MEKRISVIFLIFSLFFASCQNKNNDFDTLSDFMEQKFQLNIRDTSLTLLLITGNQCFNCINVKTEIDKLKEEGNNYLIITGGELQSIDTSHIIRDPNSNLVRFKMLEFRNTLIKVENNKIVKFDNHYTVNKELAPFFK